MSVSVTISHQNRGRFEIRVVKNNELVLLDTIAGSSAKQRDKFAKDANINPVWLLQRIEEAKKVTEPSTFEYIEPVSPQELLVVGVRGMKQPITDSKYFSSDPVDAVTKGLSYVDGLVDPVVEWQDETTACILDIDYHHILLEERPDTLRLQFLMTRIQPQPVLWFISRGKGVHALYVRQGNIPANVLAAVAGFSYTSYDPIATFEVAPRSRCTQAELHRCDPTIDLHSMRRFLTGITDDSVIDDYLEQHGLEQGRAYDHSKCPLHPDREAQRTPVYVGETGIVCKSCQAKSLCFGSRKPGFFPYSALCGSHELNDVARMVENFTHWTQAQIVLEARCRLRGKHAKLAYEGMLYLRHGNDDRITDVFRVGDNLIRGVGKWVTPERYETLTNIRGTLGLLPATRSGTGKAIVEKVDAFDQTCDLSRYGYISIRPVHGMRIFGEYLGNDSGPVSVVLPPSNLCEPSCTPLRPKYVPEGRRLGLDLAWKNVEAAFPGINRNYLMLLIAARGVSEGETGIPANIICVGPSGSGKTQTCHIAAMMTGDGCTEVPWTKDTTRFRQGYQYAVDRGSFVVVNELMKDARAAHFEPRQAFDVFLNITPESVSHAMYIGSVPIGRLPVTVVTDTSVPSDVRADIQLARRFIYVRLDARLDWEHSIITSGIGVPSNFRASSIEYADSCNAIVSHVIDRFFKHKPMTLTEIASELGFTTLEHCDEVLDDPDALPRFYEEVCKAPDITEDHRLKGPGWKYIGFDNDETVLHDAWVSVCDGVNTYNNFASSRKVMELDWSTVANVPVGTRCDVSKNHSQKGRGIAVRFRFGEYRGKHSDLYVNDQLLTCPGPRRIMSVTSFSPGSNGVHE